MLCTAFYLKKRTSSALSGSEDVSRSLFTNFIEIFRSMEVSEKYRISLRNLDEFLRWVV